MSIQRLALAVLALFFSTGAFAIPIVSTFTDLNEKAIGTGGFGTFDFEITNATGAVWTDFHFEDVDPIGFIPIESYVGPGTISLDASFQFDIVGLNVGIGEVLTFSIAEGCVGEVCFLGGAIWRGFPTINGEPPPGNGNAKVPEPGSLALLGIGLAGLGWMGRRRKKL